MKTWQKIKDDPKLLDKYLVREQVIDIIRAFFKGQGFHEAQTPILVPVPSIESNLEVFETQLRTLRQAQGKRAYLIMSPEYSLKKLIAAGIGNVFEITKCFRNEEEVSPTHNHEFTMLEWYRVGANYMDIKSDFEQLFVKIIGNETLKYQGKTYDLTLPWPKISVAEAFAKYCAIDTETLLDEDKLKAAAQKKGYKTTGATWEQIFYQIFYNEIETKLRDSNRPMVIYDYPRSQASLSKLATDPRFAQRWEVYLAGLELGNCFSELTDAADQRKRFETDLAERKRLGKTEYGLDEDFLAALEAGMPGTAGIAVGVDRLVMLAADVPTVAQTLFFPTSELFEV